MKLIHYQVGHRHARIRYIKPVGGIAEGINARALLKRSSARTSTVTGLLELVQERRSLLVSGPSNSGKMGLAQLCFQLAKQANEGRDLTASYTS